MSADSDVILLNSGYHMPLLGLGLYRAGDSADALAPVIRAACESGYRLFDTASAYGNEEALGEAIRTLGIDRTALFLTTKVWNNAQRIGDIEGAFARSLARLGCDYTDLYLIHWPVPGSYLDTWRELIRLRASGAVRSIGVSNFEIPHLERIYDETGVYPAVNQIEYHPLLDRRDLADYCRSKGIAVQAYAPLARGAYLKRAAVVLLAEKYEKTAAQIGLRYLIQLGVSAIPKSSDPARIAENAAIFDFSLTDAEMQMIAGLDEHLHAANIPDDLIGVDLSR